MTRIAIISSSGGSVFAKVTSILGSLGHPVQFHVITDRPCGIEEVAVKADLPCQRIQEKDNEAFSVKASEAVRNWGGVDFILLFYTRLITEPLFSRYPCLNLHESLLPAFKGFSAIRMAMDAGVKYFGTTLHRVDASMDGGHIVGQASVPVWPSMSYEEFNTISYFHKIYLSLLSINLFESGKNAGSATDVFDASGFESGSHFNPMIRERKFCDAMDALAKELEINRFLET